VFRRIPTKSASESDKNSVGSDRNYFDPTGSDPPSVTWEAFKKLLIRDTETTSFGIAWIENDPFVVNDMKNDFSRTILCFRYKLVINNIFMIKTFIRTYTHSKTNSRPFLNNFSSIKDKNLQFLL
jgi:hypothetical protein